MIANAPRIAVCAASFFYVFYVLCRLTYFLSKHTDYGEKTVTELGENWILGTLWMLLINAALLSAFILQHSVMASNYVKDFYVKLNLEDIERSLYNASASGALHFLISYWQTVPWMSTWNFSDNRSLWYAVTIIHIIGWCTVYTGCIMMDISELAGLKQVFYKISGRPCPMALKSRELQKYFMHMRHPSFTGFLLILWIYPVMSIDRLLIASLLTVYMTLMWTIDEDDYNYHSIVIARKEIELSQKKSY